MERKTNKNFVTDAVPVNLEFWSKKTSKVKENKKFEEKCHDKSEKKDEQPNVKMKNKIEFNNTCNIQNSNVHFGNTYIQIMNRHNKKTTPSSKMPKDEVEGLCNSIEPVCEKHILHIKNSIRSWKNLAKSLGYSYSLFENLKNEEILFDWIQQNERGATIGILSESLYDSNEFEALNKLKNIKLASKK